jgi:aryl-alcohol dehydrogenase-like predicted oxidoreductase
MSEMADQPNATLAGTIDIGADLTVNRLGFGAMRVTGEDGWGDPPDPAAAKAVLRRAVELGINFIDTADCYGPEVSENLIAEALYPYPDDLVIATKGGVELPGRDGWTPNGRPEHLRRACEDSLRRLRLDAIPVYYLHQPDPKVPLEESIGMLVRLKDEGKIRHLAVSNVNEHELRQAQRLTEIVAVQNRYNPTDRESDGLIDVCARERVAFIPWEPVIDSDHATLGPIAKARGASVHQLTLAWLLARSPCVVPIPGTGNVAHLEENVGAAGFRLTPEEFEQVDQLGRCRDAERTGSQ